MIQYDIPLYNSTMVLYMGVISTSHRDAQQGHRGAIRSERNAGGRGLLDLREIPQLVGGLWYLYG